MIENIWIQGWCKMPMSGGAQYYKVHVQSISKANSFCVLKKLGVHEHHVHPLSYHPCELMKQNKEKGLTSTIIFEVWTAVADI